MNGVKVETVVAALKELANSAVDVLRPDDELEDYLRQKLGMPGATSTTATLPRVRVRLAHLRGIFRYFGAGDPNSVHSEGRVYSRPGIEGR